MIIDAIKKVIDDQDLTRDEAKESMRDIMEGRSSDAQIAALITALRMKGEAVEEISGFAEVMRDMAVGIDPNAKTVVDTCGTGGDLSNTFNISTTSAFVVAGAGTTVAKHGNRSISSHCGSADLLEGLGVKLDIEPEVVEASIDEVGIGFMFAPMMHKAMKYAIGPRKEIGIRTVFNILGPLTNPAKANAQVLGVYSPDLTEVMAGVLKNLGSNHALVVHGQGLDELTVTGESQVSELKKGSITNYTVDPEELGLGRANLDDIRCATLEENITATTEVLSGKEGPKLDIVLLNASAALVAADKAETLVDGIKLAKASVDEGMAFQKLDELVSFTNI